MRRKVLIFISFVVLVWAFAPSLISDLMRESGPQTDQNSNYDGSVVSEGESKTDRLSLELSEGDLSDGVERAQRPDRARPTPENRAKVKYSKRMRPPAKFAEKFEFRTELVEGNAEGEKLIHETGFHPSLFQSLVSLDDYGRINSEERWNGTYSGHSIFYKDGDRQAQNGRFEFLLNFEFHRRNSLDPYTCFAMKDEADDEVSEFSKDKGTFVPRGLRNKDFYFVFSVGAEDYLEALFVEDGWGVHLNYFKKLEDGSFRKYPGWAKKISAPTEEKRDCRL